MSTQEKARQNLTETRQHQQHLQQSMLERSEAEAADINRAEIQGETQALLAKQRQEEHHRTLSMKHRSEAEIE
jgi:hypothetical protein